MNLKRYTNQEIQQDCDNWPPFHTTEHKSRLILFLQHLNDYGFFVKPYGAQARENASHLWSVAEFLDSLYRSLDLYHQNTASQTTLLEVIDAYRRASK